MRKSCLSEAFRTEEPSVATDACASVTDNHLNPNRISGQLAYNIKSNSGSVILFPVLSALPDTGKCHKTRTSMENKKSFLELRTRCSI